MIARLSPIGGTTAVAIIGLLLISLGVNLMLTRAWLDARRSASAEIAAAVERGKAEAAQEHADRQSGLVQLAELDRALVMQELREIAARAEGVRIVYRDRIRELPAPTCAPGADRVEAVNAMLRGES
jgi:hypothetical protein